MTKQKFGSPIANLIWSGVLHKNPHLLINMPICLFFLLTQNFGQYQILHEQDGILAASIHPILVEFSMHVLAGVFW